VPRPSLEMVEPKLLLRLLMSLFTDPSCLDHRSQAATSWLTACPPFVYRNGQSASHQRGG
jgi:hypothetical protein